MAALGWLEALERFRARIQDRDGGRCRNGGHKSADEQPYPDWAEGEAWWRAFRRCAARDVTARQANEPATLDEAPAPASD